MNACEIVDAMQDLNLVRLSLVIARRNTCKSTIQGLADFDAQMIQRDIDRIDKAIAVLEKMLTSAVQANVSTLQNISTKAYLNLRGVTREGAVNENHA